MVRVARAMIETAQRLGHAPPSAEECWWRITAGNAAALGLEGGGRLEPGAPADVLVIRPDIPWAADSAGLNATLDWSQRLLDAEAARVEAQTTAGPPHRARRPHGRPYDSTRYEFRQAAR